MQDFTFRVGFGYDAHRLVEGRRLVLGGVRILNAKGLEGHSDADVLIHAIIDAMLGAAGMGDIGGLFPDTDPAFQGADSLVLLREVNEKISENGFQINNIDATVVAEAPRLTPYFSDMKERIAEVLAIGPGQVNIKATTTEGMGFCGQGKGMEAFAVISLVRGSGT